MRNIIICIALILLSACSKKQEPPPPPVKTVAVPTPTVPVRHLAPDGIFFLLTRISITNDSGVVGINPGTHVTLIKHAGNKLLVTDGVNKFEVTATQLTNDIDIADNLANNDRNSQASIKAKLTQQAATVNKPYKRIAEETTPEPEPEPVSFFGKISEKIQQTVSNLRK